MQMVIKSLAGDKVFVSWSGGKDSYLALLKAREQGLNVACLLSFISAEGESRSHGLKTIMLEKQSEALGIPLHTEVVTWESYEAGFEQAVKGLKKEKKITGGVFGDINLVEHRDWVEKMCKRTVIDYNIPLWMMDETAVAEELPSRNVKALIVAIRSDLLDERWLGRIIDKDYIEYCLGKGISPCGEGGEAHTLVIDGPLFSRPVNYKTGKILRRDNRALLELSASV